MQLSVAGASTADLPREVSGNAVLRQVGWLDEHGTVYSMEGDTPLAPNILTPLYVQTGVWTEIEPGRWAVND